MIDSVKLITYNTWANRKIAEQVEGLPNELFSKEVGGSFPSIKLTLIHLLESDWLWMNRWNGIPCADIPAGWSITDASSIINLWTPIQNEIEERVKEIGHNQHKEISFITKKGDPYSLPSLDIVIHLTNHGTYHRGQIANMIRMLGEKPPSTDYFIFCALQNK